MTDTPIRDDEPHDCRSCTTTWQGCNDEMRETGKPCCLACKIKVTHGQSLAQDRLTPPEPQADTPAPQGRWIVDERGDPTVHWAFGHHEFLEPWEALPGTVDDQTDQPQFTAAYDALVDLVRRDGTAPTPEDVHAYMATEFRTWTTIGQVRSVLAAVRALRDGETR